MRLSDYCGRVLSTCVVMVVAVSVGGCGAGHPNAADVPDMVTSATVDLAAVDMEIMQAYSILLGQCAHTIGFDVPIDYSVHSVSQSYVDVGGVFRSEDEAKTTGYSSQTADLDIGHTALDAYMDTLNELERQRYDREVSGDMSGKDDSCSVRAYSELFGSYEDMEKVFNTFDDVLREQSSSALDDRDVQSAIKDEYMPCMKKAGYNVRGLRGGELAGKKFGRYRKWNEPPNDEERAMAVQDYQCQADANLMQRINNALERNAGTWMVANEAMLLERHEKLQQAREIANEVIAGKRSYEARD